MTARFGNAKLLEQKYGKLSENKPMKYEKSAAINKNATFNKILKITLPLEPSLAIVSEPMEMIKEVGSTKEITIDNYRHHLLNFIDISKLIEGRPGFKSKSYFLEDLKHLSRLLGIFKNEKNKGYFIEKIQDEIKKEFGQEPNLVSDIKNLSEEDLKNMKIIQQLFTKHRIVEPTKTDLLSKVKYIIKKYYTSTELTQQVINVIEKEWMPVK
jgi:hypothetical protein